MCDEAVSSLLKAVTHAARGATAPRVKTERSILSGGRQPAVEGCAAVSGQGRILRLRRGPYPGSAQDAHVFSE